MNVLVLWNELSENWLISFIHKCIIIFFVFGIIMIIVRWNNLPPQVPLWYSRPWGKEQLAHPMWLYMLPMGGLLIYGINTGISLFFLHAYPIFTRVLFLSSLLVNLLCLLTLINILLLIT
ncbi:hypothetical protein HY948_03300 [Candidatus Gottesmanbacteria bacterium]|nr:hypothetical protein [Candidatus Gottesmanbacteria bacterium]